MTRKRNLTAQIKPETRNAIMDQLALAADEIERLTRINATLDMLLDCANHAERPWYRRLLDRVRP